MMVRKFWAGAAMCAVMSSALAWDGPDSPAFRRVAETHAQVQPGAVDLANMPPAYDYCGIRVCYAMVAAILLTAENCRVMDLDCTRLPETQQFSALDLSRYRHAGDDAAAGAGRSSYPGLHLDGGNPHEVARIVAQETGQAASRACVSITRISQKMRARGWSPAKQHQVWRQLRIAYTAYHAHAGNARYQEGVVRTIDGIVAQDLEVGPLAAPARLAVREDSVEKFFDQLLGAAACQAPQQRVRFAGYRRVDYALYPSDGGATAQGLKHRIREVLESGRPAALTAICLGRGTPAECRSQDIHAVAISGFRKVCSARGDCRDSFKVINTWGDGWQKRYEGGWVDADVLLEHTMIQQNILGWFVDRDPSLAEETR